MDTRLPMSRMLSIPLTITFLVGLSYLDLQIPGYSFIIWYVIGVGVTASSVGGKYAYVYAFISGVCRTVVDYADHPDIEAALWLLVNVIAANMFICWLIVQKDVLLDKLRESSLTDPLTKLPNRRAFEEHLGITIAHVQRHREKLSVAYLDVDGFKAVNDKQGHHKGDDLLVLIANVLKKDLRADDLPARLGGDEFAIIYAQRDGSDGMVTRLKKDLDAAVLLHGFPVSFSIGVINYYGDKNVSCDVLVKYADKLMYEVKHNTKNAIRSRDFESELKQSHGIPT